MLMRFILLAFVVSSSCAKPAASPVPPKQEEGPTEPVEAKEPTRTGETVGGLGADVVVTQESLAGLFAGYQIEASTRSSEGMEMQVWELKRNGQLSLVVEPTDEGKVYRVGIVDPEAKTPAGIKIGAGYAELEKALPQHECFRLVEERSDSVACYGAELSSVGYVLQDAAKDFRGPLGTVPPPAKLRQARVTEILWLPEPQ